MWVFLLGGFVFLFAAIVLLNGKGMWIVENFTPAEEGSEYDKEKLLKALGLYVLLLAVCVFLLTFTIWVPALLWLCPILFVAATVALLVMVNKSPRFRK